MWIAFKDGFISVVQHRELPNCLLVRARCMAHIDAVRNLYRAKQLPVPDVVKSPRADYPYRLYVNKQDFASIVNELVMSIEYDNFKSAVGSTVKQGDDASYLDFLHSVWHAGLSMERSPANG